MYECKASEPARTNTSGSPHKCGTARLSVVPEGLPEASSIFWDDMSSAACWCSGLAVHGICQLLPIGQDRRALRYAGGPLKIVKMKLAGGKQHNIESLFGLKHFYYKTHSCSGNVITVHSSVLWWLRVSVADSPLLCDHC